MVEKFSLNIYPFSVYSNKTIPAAEDEWWLHERYAACALGNLDAILKTFFLF